jgi:hypothetical protein
VLTVCHCDEVEVDEDEALGFPVDTASWLRGPMNVSVRRNAFSKARDGPRVARSGWRCGPHRKGSRPNADDARLGEVKQARSTSEALEQRGPNAAERVEGRRRAKGNTGEKNSLRRAGQAGPVRSTVCAREQDRTERRSLQRSLHHVTIDRPREAFLQLRKKGTPFASDVPRGRGRLLGFRRIHGVLPGLGATFRRLVRP